MAPPATSSGRGTPTGLPEYPDIATKFANLVLLHHARARYDEAVPAYQRSLTILEDDPPDPNIPDWPRILENSPL